MTVWGGRYDRRVNAQGDPIVKIKYTVQSIAFVLVAAAITNAQHSEPSALPRLPHLAGQQANNSGLSLAAFVEAAETYSLQRVPTGVIRPAESFAIPQPQPQVFAPFSIPQSQNAVLPSYSTPEVPIEEAAWGGEPGYAKAPAYCPPCWAHRTSVFGEFLYLRPRDSEVAHTLIVNGNVPAGRAGVADPDYSPGYRVGFTKALDECSSLVGTYTNFESNTNDFLDVNPPPALRGLLLHPGTTNAGADFLTATARYDIDFRTADFDYRGLLSAGDSAAINYVIGARYAHLDQDLRVVYSNAGTAETIITDVEFDGAGFRLGLDAERCTHHGFLFYGKSMATFLVGDFRATYNHASTAGGATVANTAWRAGRIVPILDLELGTGWQSHSGHWRMTAGYVVSAWLNTVNTDEWVEAVRGNSFEGLNDGMTFDGLTAKAEYRF